jgi:hypothetical protein
VGLWSLIAIVPRMTIRGKAFARFRPDQDTLGMPA